MRYLIFTILLLFSVVAFGEDKTYVGGLGRAARAAQGAADTAANLSDLITGGGSPKGAASSLGSTSTTSSISSLGSPASTSSLGSPSSTGSTGSTSSTGTSPYDKQLASLDTSYNASINAVNNGTSPTAATTTGNQPTLADAASATPAPDPNDPAVFAARYCMARAGASGNTNNAQFYADCLCDVIYPGPNKPPQCQSQGGGQNDQLLMLLLLSQSGGGGGGNSQSAPQAAPAPDVFVALPPPCDGKQCKDQN